MAEEDTRQPIDSIAAHDLVRSGRVYRAHVWCPMNKGHMIIEYSPGDKMGDLIRVLRERWGIALPTSRGGFEYAAAGWNVLGEGADGVNVPLHIEDDIPLSPRELSEWLDRGGRGGRRAFGNERFEDGVEVGERDWYRWMMTTSDMRGMHVETGSSDEERDDLHHAEHWRWPGMDEPVDINLCVVVAIAGG